MFNKNVEKRERVERIIEIENAEILYPNFSGLGSRYNRDGDRNFCVFIDDTDLAMELADEGWNIKIKQPRFEDEQPRYYLPVKVMFNKFPPRVRLITKNNPPRPLNEDTISLLDDIEYAHVDVVIRPYNYDSNGKTGVSAYLKELYVTMVQSKFADKYPDDVLPFDND